MPAPSGSTLEAQALSSTPTEAEPQTVGSASSEDAPASSAFEALPYTPTAERAAVVSRILRETARHETLFTDFERACPDVCFNCEQCIGRLRTIAQMLSRPDARVWEVWRSPAEGIEDLVGILYLTRVTVGSDALAHYVFFDNELSSKTSLLESMIEWAFSDHPDEGWRGLKRLTVEVPDFAFALARHAVKKLGFGGPFRYDGTRSALPVEGVLRRAVRWRGADRDILILGKLRETADG